MANVSPEMVFGILFLILNDANVDFLDWKLRWRTYTTQKALLTTKCIKLVEKKKFVVAAIELKYKTFVVFVTSLSPTLFNIGVYLFYKPQMASLIAENLLIKVFAKYVDFTDVFFPDLVSKFFKHIKINDHAIELVDGQ